MSTLISKKYGLSKQENTVMWALMTTPRVNVNGLVEAVWPDPDLQPDFWHNHINVLIAGIRKKINPFGWTIRSEYGRGWTLEKVE